MFGKPIIKKMTKDEIKKLDEKVVIKETASEPAS